MEIFAKFSMDRTDGKTESTENVEAELLNELQANIDSIDVEDSTYEVQDVEIVERPGKRTSGTNVDLGPALLRLADAYFQARPVVINIHPPGDPRNEEDAVRTNLSENERSLDNAIFHLLNQGSNVIAKAKVSAHKAAARKR